MRTRADYLAPRPPPAHQLQVVSSRRREQSLVKITAIVFKDIEANTSVGLTEIRDNVSRVAVAVGLCGKLRLLGASSVSNW